MSLKKMFPPGGRGVIATSGSSGSVNTAIYAQPRVIDEKTIAWGMTEGRTWMLLKENPHASYLYMNPGPGFTGVRLGLTLKEFISGGDLLEEIRAHTTEIVSPAAGQAVKHVAYFEVTEVRPLV
jgi:hypothetical protein